MAAALTGCDGETDRPIATWLVEGTDIVAPEHGVPAGRYLVGRTLLYADTPLLLRRVVYVQTLHGPVTLYDFTAERDGRRVALCQPDRDGRRLALPVLDAELRPRLTCTSGAQGKCILWGYRPWEETSRGPPLADLFAACTRMVRADYAGDGRTFTKDGVTIFVCDRFGVRPCSDKPPFAFEAAWNADGAVCLARPRLGGNAPPIAPCGADRGGSGALLYNWSMQRKCTSVGKRSSSFTSAHSV
ncbi:ADYC domain-containing protein [Acuticoccus sp. MNP-M23]|uniref:ADYC domain-containing protein n=1 Tax=Acuticoccus sp. MNP-M23 TaxID=3072793 RepID=UPI0028157847|nr:ADYC domain-containing protein [Acuticoccus sp. MNP-M23]WMS43458.1 ADYC domain-containing protein [Acuticoccus sp. MNP-M23]